MTEDRTHPTKILAPELGLGWQTGFDIVVDVQEIGHDGEIERDWNGNYVDMTEPEFQLYEIRISSSDDMLPPALANMWKGKVFSIVPPNEHTLVIPTGGSSVQFPRKIHSVRAITMSSENVPVTFLDKVATLVAPAVEPIRVIVRFEHEVVVTQPYRNSMQEREVRYTWDLTTEETGNF